MLATQSWADVLPVDRKPQIAKSEIYKYEYVQAGEETEILEYKTFYKKPKYADLDEAYWQIMPSAQDRIQSVTDQDLKTNIVRGEWSGTDIDSSGSYTSLNSMAYTLWKSCYSKIRHQVFTLVESKHFNNLMTLSVVLNTIVLAMDHYGISK